MSFSPLRLRRVFASIFLLFLISLSSCSRPSENGSKNRFGSITYHSNNPGLGRVKPAGVYQKYQLASYMGSGVNSGNQPTPGFEFRDNRVAVVHNQGRMVRDGVLFANVSNLGEAGPAPMIVQGIVPATPTTPAPGDPQFASRTLMPVGALPEKDGENEEEDEKPLVLWPQNQAD